MIAWKYVTEYGWDGEMAAELELGFVNKRRFSAVDIARSSDLDSNFNLKVVSDLNKCDPTHKKYARGLLPSETACRRIQDRVHRAAVRHGLSSFPAEKEGNGWCWGDEDGRFTKGVNRYVYAIYYKTFNSSVTKANPWIVPVTGDLARVSYWGKAVTMCGPKEADSRLPSQNGGYVSRGDCTRQSVKVELEQTMNQSRKLYTPAVAGFTSESDMIPYFCELVQEQNQHKNRTNRTTRHSTQLTSKKNQAPPSSAPFIYPTTSTSPTPECITETEPHAQKRHSRQLIPKQ
jgi:hypothetical protein